MPEKLLSRPLLFLLASLVSTSTALFTPGIAQAETLLTQAIIQSLRNSVRLILRDQAPRPAKRQDRLTPGDALATAQASLAELRFNDGSLARIGERALFRFVSHSRTFRLDNGIVLLLIPPGQGQTRVKTPNAAAGIRGSALFVQYAPASDTTVIGALTNSGIEVGNRNRSQNQSLQAGQLAVVVKDRITRIYNFDLRTFYETNELVQGLDLSQSSASGQSDPAIAAVRAETIAALQAQTRSSEVSFAQSWLRLEWLLGVSGEPSPLVQAASKSPTAVLSGK